MTDDAKNKLLVAAISSLDKKRQDQISAFILDDAPLPQQASVSVEPFLTLKDLAAQLHFHPSTLWRWDIPKHDLAGRPRFLASEVVAYLNSDAFKLRARALRRNRRTRSAT